jgi:hypothetical protein
MTDRTKAWRINTPTADRCTKCGATADGAPCAYPSERQPGCIWPDGVIDITKPDPLDGIKPSAWASLSPSRKVTYFDGKPMLIAGAVGNEMHDEPLYDRTAIQSAIERARADGLEQAAKWVDARRDTYMLEHGTFDPFTGQLEFGRGVMGEIKIEHIGELSGISEGIRALDASPKAQEGGQS